MTAEFIAVSSNNFFEIFGLPVAYAVDLSVLSDRFRALQKTCHPDRYAGRSQQEQRLAMQRAATINQAYQTLKTPIKRAHYLLELQGWGEDAERYTVSDTTFLMQQMALREQLQEAGSVEQLEAIRQEAQQVFRVLAHSFAQAVAQEKRAEALTAFTQMQFYDKLLRDVELLEEDLDH